MRRLQSFAAPVVATFGVNPCGRNPASAASGTLKSSWKRVSLLLSIGVSAKAVTVNRALVRARIVRVRMRGIILRADGSAHRPYSFPIVGWTHSETQAGYT